MIEVVIRLLPQCWNDEVDLEKIIVLGSDDGSMFLYISRAPLRGDQLRTSHVVLSLHQAVWRMAARGEEHFSGVRARLLLRKKPIGIISFSNERPPGSLTTVGSPSVSALRTYALPLSISDLEATSGEIRDPKNPNLRITWEFENGHASLIEVFTAFIDTLVAIAPRELSEPFTKLMATALRARL